MCVYIYYGPISDWVRIWRAEPNCEVDFCGPRIAKGPQNATGFYLFILSLWFQFIYTAKTPARSVEVEARNRNQLNPSFDWVVASTEKPLLRCCIVQCWEFSTVLISDGDYAWEAHHHHRSRSVFFCSHC